MYRSNKPAFTRSSTTSTRASTREQSPIRRAITTPSRGLDLDITTYRNVIDLSSDETEASVEVRSEDSRWHEKGLLRRAPSVTDRKLIESQLAEKEAISSMVNWIESVGKPALDTQESLYAKLHEKDNEWRRALIELESLKDENKDLQQSLKNRPTNKQHQNEKGRATRLEVSIQRLEQHLQQKEHHLRSVTKQAQKMMKNGKQLETNKTQLANTLNKVTQDFACQLKRVKKRNMNLESTVVEKEKDMERLLDAVRVADKKRQEGLLRKVVSNMSQTVSAKKMSRKRGNHHQLIPTPRPEMMAAAQAVTPKNEPVTPRNLRLGTPEVSSIRSAPSTRSVVSIISTRRDYTLTNFLESITSLSRRVEENDLEMGGTDKIERSLSAFQEEIQRCIENWSQGEVPHEEILGLMERVFEEWANERSARMKLEHEVGNMRDQQHGINKQFAVMWLPMRIAGWFIWVPVKIGTLSFSTYVYLMKKVLSAAGGMLGGGNWSPRAGSKETPGFSHV